ncbi:hypothetical protein IG193_04285 [Infirmifilum lucidum]|uniref:Uncharacterized protein n=1 Tax=Infirmifilum lucidum TaxID=2776706 RepID=A0A7L9FIL3_9CREN|nr:hypothetical protein [Infirmifilum lucidum]QOJ79678.1 hypothetical protein IG193_04285 [Infirmifilum lucidum]
MSTLGELEVLFLLSFTDAPPSYVLTWLANRGIEYRIGDNLKRIISEDERAGSRAGIRTALEEAVRGFEYRLDAFSARVDTLSEVFNITLLVAPVMLYSVGLLQPYVLEKALPLLLLLNTILVFLYRDLHPKVLVSSAGYKLFLALLVIFALSSALLMHAGLEYSLIFQTVVSFPLSLLTVRKIRSVEAELNENKEILVKALQSPGHIFRAVSPESLLSDTMLGLSRSLRLTVYLSSIWGIEDPSLLLLTYEKLYNFHRKLMRKGFTNATMNLVTLFLLGFASSVIKGIYASIPLESINQWITISDPRAINLLVDLYLAGAVVIYSSGLSVLSTGSAAFTALWLPVASLVVLVGGLLGNSLLGGVHV